MAEKILYITGAGASAQALPIAKTVWGANEFEKPKIPGLSYSLRQIDLTALFTEVGSAIIAGFFRNDLLDVGSVFQSRTKTSQEKLLDFMEANSLDNTIRFAWERDDNQSKLLERVNIMIEGTTILVVIGYSFPFFNREVDKKIFDKLKAMTSFKKIYYQDLFLVVSN